MIGLKVFIDMKVVNAFFYTSVYMDINIWTFYTNVVPTIYKIVK